MNRADVYATLPQLLENCGASQMTNINSYIDLKTMTQGNVSNVHISRVMDTFV